MNAVRELTSPVENQPPVAALTLRIVCVISFLNEQRYLPRLLESLDAQSRLPDELLLVDDGSSDDSPRIAGEFADRHPQARLLRRPRRSPARDRLADASVVRALQWALSKSSAHWDVAVKMDADLALTPDLFATMEQAFLEQPDLGIAGAHLSVVDPQTGEQRRERCRHEHADGPSKFYRRTCYEQIDLPAILGWDTIDEVDARRRGWRTASVACPAGDTIHLRPMGAHDGLVRAQFRWGTCAYAIGQHPAWVAASSVRRLADPPRVVSGAAFAAGWLTSPVRRVPRASADVRAFGRREQARALRHLALALARGPNAARQLIQ